MSDNFSGFNASREKLPIENLGLDIHVFRIQSIFSRVETIEGAFHALYENFTHWSFNRFIFMPKTVVAVFFGQLWEKINPFIVVWLFSLIRIVFSAVVTSSLRSKNENSQITRVLFFARWVKVECVCLGIAVCLIRAGD